MTKRIAGWIWASPLTIIACFYTAIFQLLGWYKFVELVDDSLVWQVEFDKCPSWLKNLWEGWAGHAIGNVVVLAHSIEENPRTFVHESQHVKQCMRLGIFQPIAYLLCLLFIKLACTESNMYYDNPFEIDARRKAGQLIDIRKGSKL